MTFVQQLIAILQQQRDNGERYVQVAPENASVLQSLLTAEAPPLQSGPAPAAEPAVQPARAPLVQAPVLPSVPATGATSAAAPSQAEAVAPRSVERLAEIDSLRELQQILQADTSCPSCARMEKRRIGRGKIGAPMAIVAARPGQETRGAAGDMLKKMLMAMKVSPQDVYVTSVMRCQPDFVDIDMPETIPCCTDYLHRELQLARPQAIVLMGALPLHVLFEQRLDTVHGRWFEFGGIPCLATYPPSFLLFEPKLKRATWNDLQEVMTRLGAGQ